MVLGTKPIGMRDNFFDLGGSTLPVRQLLARIKEISGKKIPLSTFFQAQTVEQLATVLKREVLVVEGHGHRLQLWERNEPNR